MLAPISIVNSGCSGRVIATIALSMAWRMSSSETPCLRALGRISTTTTLVVVVSPCNGEILKGFNTWAKALQPVGEGGLRACS